MKKNLVLGILVIILVLSFCCLTSCQKGSLNFSADDGIMEYKIENFSGEDERTFDCEEDIELEVRIEKLSGKIDIKIIGENGEKVYASNNAESGTFSLIIPKSSLYTITLDCKNTTANITISYVDKY